MIADRDLSDAMTRADAARAEAEDAARHIRLIARDGVRRDGPAPDRWGWAWWCLGPAVAALISSVMMGG